MTGYMHAFSTGRFSTVGFGNLPLAGRGRQRLQAVLRELVAEPDRVLNSLKKCNAGITPSRR